VPTVLEDEHAESIVVAGNGNLLFSATFSLSSTVSKATDWFFFYGEVFLHA